MPPFTVPSFRPLQESAAPMPAMSSASSFVRISFALFLTLTGCTGANRGDATPPVMTALDAMDARQRAEEEAARTAENAAQAAGKNAASEVAADPADSANGTIPREGVYRVRFETTAGDFVVEVHRDWAPIGAQRFFELVSSGFYDECRFFRVVPDFMVQFGINGDPAVQGRWKKNIMDDPVTQSNLPGYITFAKTGLPNSRTTQVFVNYSDNSRLDADGFAPFGKVTEGMENVTAIYSGYRERPDQMAIQSSGNSYLQKAFPNLDSIRKATIITD